MRFDLVSIFPQYFDSLSLSLLGRADRSGLVSVRAHDLRDWAHGAHRSVDDAPYGGGAGMVMLPGVWCAALDEILGASCAPVLAVPTPSGTPLTQRLVGELARADHIVVACGRYEGIDQRVADHYRERGLRVLEYSIGDYVLNGGEAAAAVLVEAVARLVDGFMGNPDSLAEESHGDGGLLEYPAYTKPRSFRGLDVPDVLLSGDHGAIRRWRRDQSLLRTAQRRPDLIDALDPAGLDAQDREALASCGVVFAPGPTRVRYLPGEQSDAAELAAFAARTFPMAVPPQIPAEDVARFIREELDEASFRDHLAGPGTRVLIARAQGGEGGSPILGYTLTVLGHPDQMPEGNGAVPLDGGAAYLSKCYTDAAAHGSGLAGALLEGAVSDARAHGATQIVLATHIRNTRAQRFYKRHGFKKSGRRTFRVGSAAPTDDVMVRPADR